MENVKSFIDSEIKNTEDGLKRGKFLNPMNEMREEEVTDSHREIAPMIVSYLKWFKEQI